MRRSVLIEIRQFRAVSSLNRKRPPSWLRGGSGCDRGELVTGVRFGHQNFAQMGNRGVDSGGLLVRKAR